MFKKELIGIKDSTGKPIREGHIVTLVNRPDLEYADHMQGTGVVRYMVAELGFQAQQDEGDRNGMFLTWNDTESITIIGDVYDKQREA